MDWFPAAHHRATLVLGHGTATGVEAADLQALAHALPARGVTVALVTQPYRIEHNPSVADPASLDRAWAAVWARITAVTSPGPVIAGGRSAGSQVVCRTAKELGAAAALVLAYPVRGPGSPGELASVTLPTLVVQGGRDPFGTAAELPALPGHMTVVEIPRADHMFLASSDSASRGNLEAVVTSVAVWLDAVLGTAGGQR
ncbi:alpha/beta hydrolase family protein [Streptacidiphilus fuscans]|uniref:alpha/beta hydrolase family protein n=1 Tax=Streptacidiphilus fuscans TaxID=2789292 RepID=UPI002E2AD82F|nr:alpha/beta family hydrolase [Streptacidiphilus fuscans]